MRRQLSGVVKYCWPASCWPGEHVPQPEFGFEPAVALARDPPGRQRLRVDGAPIGKSRHGVNVGDFFKKGRRIDRREQAAALEVAGDDLRNALRGFVVAGRAAEKIRDRDRHRLDVALRDVDGDRGSTRWRERKTGQRGTAERERVAAAQALWQITRVAAEAESQIDDFIRCIRSPGSAKNLLRRSTTKQLVRIEVDFNVFPLIVVLRLKASS